MVSPLRGLVRISSLRGHQGPYAVLKALPHSRQHRSWRGVTSPQNGHIRWEAKSPACASIFKNFLSEALRKARRLRRLATSGCGEKDMLAISLFYSDHHDDTALTGVLCKIALFWQCMRTGREWNRRGEAPCQ
jgi:hypothetical protein